MRTLFVLMILPPAGPLLLAFLGALWVRRRLGRWLLGLGLALAWALSIDAVVEPLTWAWARVPPNAEVQRSLNEWRRQPDTVVLVLGGGLARGMHADGGYDLKPETAARLRRGLWWSRQLGLPLAFTGGRSPLTQPDQPTEAAMAGRVAQEEWGQALAWAEAESVNTRGNAELTARLLAERGIRRVVLVTHGQHMPRALRAFRAASPGVEFRPAPLMRDLQAPKLLQNYLPSTTGVERGRYLVYEVMGYLAGH